MHKTFLQSLTSVPWRKWWLSKILYSQSKLKSENLSNHSGSHLCDFLPIGIHNKKCKWDSQENLRQKLG